MNTTKQMLSLLALSLTLATRASVDPEVLSAQPAKAMAPAQVVQVDVGVTSKDIAREYLLARQGFMRDVLRPRVLSYDDAWGRNGEMSAFAHTHNIHFNSD
jgi:hypothetical protein